jgi:GMP synthase (glutamine-hydrolysing)
VAIFQMAHYIPEPQITVLDTGGQYCHLIARKVRELGVYAEVRPSETPAEELRVRKGVIISGGPNSVYEENSPSIDPAILSQGAPVLGICYGLQLMAHLLGGSVRKGKKGEYGLAFLDIRAADALFEDLLPHQQVWMSHRDVVTSVPAGFRVLGSTDTCDIAAMADPDHCLYGVQFHPEVVHTWQGREILANFLFRICGCEKDWDPKHRVPFIEDSIRETVQGRNVFFFVSGGVDSTVAFTLCVRALGPERTRGIYVDTGLMRDGETAFVRSIFEGFGKGALMVECASEQFLTALGGVHDPEWKRQIIGEEFVRVQQRIIESQHLLDDHWVLGQGTIYPDTIESGGTEKAAVIKTHHNRVPGIRRLMEMNRIVEPLNFFYKDEVREIGRELGLPSELLERHPFPGPGLAIRCLCAAARDPVRRAHEGWVLPVRSVGVQGDSRSYAEVLSVEGLPSEDGGLQSAATDLINRVPGINRIVTRVDGHCAFEQMEVFPGALTAERLERLRRADTIVRRLSRQGNFDQKVWQFPVILVPLGRPDRPDSVVLRPVHSVDGMTAQSVGMEINLLRTIATELLRVDGICTVFYDLTHKPPATIEWE